MTRQTPVRSASEFSARLFEARAEATVRILETDPELGLRVPASQIRDARRRLTARVKSFDCGRWEVPHEDADRGGLGFLMLEGLLARDVILAGATSTELVGEGDVVQPWVPAQEDRLVRYHVLWHVLAPVRLAVIDSPFVRSSAAWPAVMNALFERAIRRAMRMSVHQALLQLSPIETRLLVLFWHLAERWGRVTPTGITLRLRLPHELLGQLVGSQRASVTTALRRLNESGLVTRGSDGNWQLRGEPPDELGDIEWQRSIAG